MQDLNRDPPELSGWALSETYREIRAGHMKPEAEIAVVEPAAKEILKAPETGK